MISFKGCIHHPAICNVLCPVPTGLKNRSHARHGWHFKIWSLYSIQYSCFCVGFTCVGFLTFKIYWSCIAITSAIFYVKSTLTKKIFAIYSVRYKCIIITISKILYDPSSPPPPPISFHKFCLFLWKRKTQQCLAEIPYLLHPRH